MEKEEEILSLLRQHSDQLRKISRQTDKTRRYILYLEIINFLKIGVIVIPILFAVVYGLPLLQDAWRDYQAVMGALRSPTDVMGQDIWQFIK